MNKKIKLLRVIWVILFIYLIFQYFDLALSGRANKQAIETYDMLYVISLDRSPQRYDVVRKQLAKYNLKQLAAQERYKKEILGTTATIQSQSLTIDTSRGARDIFVQTYLLMGDADTVNWKFPETWLTLTKQDLGLCVTAATQYVQECFDWELNKSEEIDNSETKQELLAIII